MTPTDWTEYEARYARHRDAMRGILASLGETEEINVSERGFHVTLWRDQDDLSLDVSLSLLDSGEADDGVYGEHGNFSFSIIEFGGVVLAAFSPGNYTPAAWAFYGDDVAWERKIGAVPDAAPHLLEVVREWQEARP
ncbi:hypothetical protein LCGC14_2244720 [marine sediment metagenome]|uniref:Uncharacterized protein n=1 Tax=marine sediment metagenome TaxID=412755 RepID=A0A0F9D4K6_9ZZZZ